VPENLERWVLFGEGLNFPYFPLEIQVAFVGEVRVDS
jgi:hypothetical protein